MQAPSFNNNKVIFILICSFSLFSSCKRKDDAEVIRMMEESLINSNRTIGFSNQQIIHSMRNKTEDPFTKERALAWYHVSEQIQTYASEINGFIEQLKKEKQIRSGQINNLYKNLKDYTYKVLTVDSSLKKEFEQSRQLDDLTMGEADFTKTFFSNLSAYSTHAVLTKFQNNIVNDENMLLRYCYTKTTSAIIIDDFPAALVSQNSTGFKPGDEIKITAGIGIFKKMTGEEISVEGSIIPVEETGVAVYKLKAAGIGKHYLPVRISYLDANGKNAIFEHLIEYTVTKPCGQ